jgi:cell division protein FtsQ
MARISGPPIPDDDLSSRTLASDSSRTRGVRGGEADELDPRLLDLDIEEEAPFLRAQKRVPVRRGTLPRKAANRLKLAILVLILLGATGAIAGASYRFGAKSWRFRLESSDHIEVFGARRVGRAQIMQVMGADIGRNVFFIPLEQRRAQLEEIPWVESASIGRLLPNHIRVDVRERTPIAFVKLGSKFHLVDSYGVVMELPPKRAGAEAERFSFPVIVGMGAAEPASTRSARIKIYRALIDDLDSDGAGHSKDLSEVDLSDPEDVKITTADPAGGVLIHLGASGFLERYKLYIANLQQWRRQYQPLRSVDLRYEGQVILNGDENRPLVQRAQPRARRAKSRN